jgi:cyclase
MIPMIKPQQYTSKYFELVELGEGIFAAMAYPGTGAMANAGIVDLGGKTLVFDTFFTPQAAADLRAVSESLFQRPVHYVVNSHFHTDHVLGNQAFADSLILSTAKTRDLIADRTGKFIEYAKAHPEYPDQVEQSLLAERDERKRMELAHHLGDVRGLVESFSYLELTLPFITYERTLTLHGSNRQAVLMSKGGGHSPCDAIMYLPNEEIVFMGDLLSDGVHPSLKDGNPLEWIRILEEILELPFRQAVPGHGNIGDKGAIQSTLCYLRVLVRLAADLDAKGTTIEELAHIAVPEPYAEWEVPSLFSRNLQRCFELRDVITMMKE